MRYNGDMKYASVVLDISTRALGEAFSYAIPASLDAQVDVGATVLVTFSHRPSVGYVITVDDAPPPGLDAKRVLPIEQVLAPSAFDARGAELALWMAHEYACNLADAIHLLLAPGQKVHVRRAKADGSWIVQDNTVEKVDDRWVSLTEEGRTYRPRDTARRQRGLLLALQAGPVTMSELNATMPGAATVVRSLQKRGVVNVVSRRHIRGTEATTLSSAQAPRPQVLTEGQSQALAAIRVALDAGRGDVVLVDGVTGSGKTEVYLRAIEETLHAGKGAIVLVPEISLTAQTVGRFRSRFGNRVAVLHSRLGVGERFDQWDMVRQGSAQVVIGARSALFAPMHNLGLIIIDEEHEGSYKQDGPPRYHARDVAAELARLRGAALVLGSATPTLESLARAQQGSWRGAAWTRVQMYERPGDAVLPEVRVVDMAAAFRDGGRSVFSAELAEALLEVAQRREKAVLLLNRRGFASFLMCRECGCVPECPHCSTSLTYHERTHALACHSCGRSWAVHAWPDVHTRCPNCGSRYMAAFGVGTQRVEDELRMLVDGVPNEVTVIRMDADTTRGKGAHQKLLEQFDAADCAVLVGTQMIAKGLDFPEVTLVGVVNADTVLKLPDFRSAERTYALLEQVAGRAGRGERPGKVIIQTYWASHPAIQAVALHERSVFLDAELPERKEAFYPPFSRIANLVVSGVRTDQVFACCDEIAQRVRMALQDLPSCEVLGPADCLKARVKDHARRHILVKVPIDADVGGLLGPVVRGMQIPSGISVAVDVDAHDFM